MTDRVATKEEQAEFMRGRGDALGAAALQNSERMQVTGLELENTPWSNVPLYGYGHCQQVSMLGHELGITLGLSPRDLNAVKLAGLMHDCGRTRPWMFPEPGHQKVSAELAVRALRGSPLGHGDDWLRDRVEFLILGMDLQAPELPRDPALRALWDVDALESARLSPGTAEGMRVFRQRTARDRLCSDFAHARRLQMLQHHGWPGV